LESGKSDINKKTYDALKAEQHPKIKYTLTNVRNLKRENGQWIVIADGKLKIAGTEKTVTLTATVSRDNGYRFTGKTSIKMTTYNIDPPTAMWGTIKAYDPVTVHYNVLFVHSK
jgi:polyisoprenoid-binding protein YceI